MIDALIDPFRQGIGQRALLELVMIGSVCGPLGVWVVLYRQSYAAESIAHAMLPGLVVAALIGLPLGLGAAGGLAVAVLALALVGRQRGIDADIAVAVVVTTLFALGGLLALSPSAPPRLAEFLFGDPLSISSGDLLATAALCLALLAAGAISHRTLSLAAFDPVAARSFGASPALAGAVLLALLAATILVAVQALGNLLVVALVVAPGAAALRMTARLAPALGLAAALGLLSGVGGLYVSYYVDLAAGASIALTAIAVYALALAVGSSRRGARVGARRPLARPGPAALE